MHPVAATPYYPSDPASCPLVSVHAAVGAASQHTSSPAQAKLSAPTGQLYPLDAFPIAATAADALA